MSDQPRRVNFFHGMLLTAEDLAAEQEYHRGMRYLHNRLHGYGTVTGLDVTVSKGRVEVSAGWGIDVHGREIVLAAPLGLDLKALPTGEDGRRDLVILWCEVPDGPVPSPDGDPMFVRWLEQPKVMLCVPGDEPPEALLLARLKRTKRHSIDVDTSVRRPLGPA